MVQSLHGKKSDNLQNLKNRDGSGRKVAYNQCKNLDFKIFCTSGVQLGFKKIKRLAEQKNFTVLLSKNICKGSLNNGILL
jgi:hypothetical protein